MLCCERCHHEAGDAIRRVSLANRVDPGVGARGVEAREGAHAERVDRATEAHRRRRADGRGHPVEDFLFTYYRTTPAQLRRWHPGPGVVLADADDFGPEYVATDGGVTLDTAALLARRGDSVRWIRDLLVATQSRPAQFGCFGLHEWAMVYRQPEGEIRHQGWPLRLGAAGTAAVVEQSRIRCSHFDAYRFFTAEARPLTLVEDGQDRGHSIDPRGRVADRDPDLRWSGGRASHRQDAGFTLEQEVEALPLAERPVRAVAGDRAPDEPRVQGVHLVPGQHEALRALRVVGLQVGHEPVDLCSPGRIRQPLHLAASQTIVPALDWSLDLASLCSRPPAAAKLPS